MENEPNEVQVLGQLDKIVSSEGFVSSPRMRKFLRYIVEKTLAGEQASLKGYSIGVDVFERGDNFDPQADTIVRVQARNLRRALRIYNLSDGINDEVKIDLVKGNYVPQFSFNEASADIATPANDQAASYDEVEIKEEYESKTILTAKPKTRFWPIFLLVMTIFILGVLFGINA